MEFHKLAIFLYSLSFCFFPNETYPTSWFVSQHYYIFHALVSDTPERLSIQDHFMIRDCHVFLDSQGQRAVIFLCHSGIQGILPYLFPTPCLWVGTFSSVGVLFSVPACYVNLSMCYTLVLFASHLKISLFLRGVHKLAFVSKLKFQEYLKVSK